MDNRFKISLCFSMAMSIYCSSAFAATASIKWCANWPTKFIDSNYGEDLFTARNTVEYSRAQYAKYKIKKVSDTSWTYGYLDTDGCTPAMPTDSSTSYDFRTAYTRYRNGRAIYVNPDAFAEDGSYKAITITTPSIFGGSYISTNFTSWNTRTNMAQLAGKTLEYDSSRNWPAGSTTYISTMDNPGCAVNGERKTGAMGNRICINEDQITSDGTHYDHGRYKFVIAHEMGHVQANGTGGPGGPSSGSYDNSTWPVFGIAHNCNCVQNNPLSPPSICLRSRTFIETAAQEGWANFFAAALLNNRSSANGAMAIWNKSFAMVNGSPEWEYTPPFQFNMLERWKWMENNCGTGVSDKGVITDWMQFFWQVWTLGGSNRYDMNVLTSIWNASFNTYDDGGDNYDDTDDPDTDGGYDEYAKWNTIVGVMNDQISTQSKRTNFTYIGDQTGINH